MGLGIKSFIHTKVSVLSNKLSRKNLEEWLDESLSENGQSVVHVGAGGPLTRFIKEKKKNIQLQTLDINPDYKPDIVCDLTDMAVFQDNSVDLFVVLEVLEHVQNPQKAVNEIFRVLKPGGKVIVSTPFIFQIHDMPHDYWRFTSYGLKLLLENFMEVEVRERNGCMESLVVALARAGRAPKGLRLRQIIFLALAYLLWPLAGLYDRIFPDNRCTTGYFVTARKP